jgi:hypothetical protein
MAATFTYGLQQLCRLWVKRYRSGRSRHVSFAPGSDRIADIRDWQPRANDGSRASFDDLVGGRQQARREIQSERFRRCSIKHQFELGWLVERDLRRLRAL